MIDMHAQRAAIAEGLAAVGREEDRQAQHVDALRVGRIDANLAK